MQELVSYKSIENLRKPGKPIIIVAAVREAEAIANACTDNKIKVEAFCDTEKRKTGKKLCNLDVIHTPELPTKFPEARFILATQHINEATTQLSEFGYQEIYSGLELLESYQINKHKHLISNEYMESRISVYKKTHEAYFKTDSIYMRSIDIMITTKCSLKCQSCSNLMQYYKTPTNFNSEKTLEALEVLRNNVDEISEFRIIGGEPMINKDWYKIVNGIIDKNPERNIYIYTNGTIPAKDQQLERFIGNKVNFIITDYGNLSKNKNQLIEKLEKFKISYVSTPAENWLDCSRIKHHKRSTTELQEVFRQCCVKYVYTLLDGKLYRCPWIANAANLKAIPDNKANYVDLSSKDNVKSEIKRLVKVAKFFPACDFCDGRPYDPTSKKGYSGEGMIEPGIQSPSSIDYKIYN